MNVRRVAAALSVPLAFVAGAAIAQSPETLSWLRKIQDATRNLSYTGTFVYQQGNRNETSRLTRLATADTEKLEVLDGLPRELIRTRDTVRCYLPEAKVVKVERRTPDRTFPALLPDQLNALAEHYDIALGGTERIGGIVCQGVMLTPKDALRYGYRLYADKNTGMLMRAVTVDAAGTQIEQFTFTQLSFGHITPDMVRSSHAGANFRIEDAQTQPARLAGWGLTSELPGFHKIVELTRRLGDSKPAGQVVYSDGIAAVSVFIEPLQGKGEQQQPGLASLGAIHVYTRQVANHRVTVVGEAPATSVQLIGNAVEYRRP